MMLIYCTSSAVIEFSAMLYVYFFALVPAGSNLPRQMLLSMPTGSELIVKRHISLVFYSK